MRDKARAVVQMARANQTRNDESKADTTARRAKMACGDWQAGRQIKKPGQAPGHRQERQEGRLAEGQAAQGSHPRCVTITDARRHDPQAPGPPSLSILFARPDRGGGVLPTPGTDAHAWLLPPLFWRTGGFWESPGAEIARSACQRLTKADRRPMVFNGSLYRR